MAAVEDVTLSVYTRVKAFADSVDLDFSATTSMESASSLMLDSTDRLIFVQDKLEDKLFLDIEYRIFISFAKSLEVNALKTTEIMSKFFLEFPRFDKICIFEASGLKEVPSIFTDTGKAMVVKDIGQEIISRTQLRDNLNAIVLKLTGYIK